MIAKLQIFFLMLLIWIQTANYQLGATYDNFPIQKLGFRFILLIIVISILLFNVIVIDSLKSIKKSHEKNNFYLIRLAYPIVITSTIICLNPSKKELSIGMLLFTFFIAIDWFDGFKDIKNTIVEKLNDYRTNRGLPIADQDASIGLFLLLPIDCVLIYLAVQRFF